MGQNTEQQFTVREALRLEQVARASHPEEQPGEEA